MRFASVSCIVSLLVAGSITAPLARADEEANARQAVEGFVSAVQAGDEAAMKAVVTATAEQKPAVDVYLDLMAATSKLQKAAVAKFGASAATTFGSASGPQFEARLKTLHDAPIKLTGNSALLTLPADPATKKPGGTIILVKSGAAWKIDGGSLFGLTPENQEQTQKNVAVAGRLVVVAQQIITEINAGKYAAAVDAYQEFWDRSAKAAKADGSAAATTRAGGG